MAAGQSTFNERYDTFGQLRTQTGWAVEFAQDSGFLAIHTTRLYEEPLLYLLTAVTRISPAGEFITVGHSPLALHSTYPGWANSSDRTSDGRIVIGGGTYHPGDIQRPALIFFHPTSELDTLIEFDIDAYEWIGRQAKQTPDGGFVICGETSSTGFLDGFLLKTDSQGELEWVNTYGGSTFRDYIMTVDLAPDGGYYLGGQKEMSFQSFDLWVLRVDSVGEVLWEDTYGSPFDDNIAHLTTLADDLPIFAGGVAVAGSPPGVYRPCLVKLDADGDVIWEQYYGEAVFNTTLFAVKEIDPGGDLIAVGQHYISNLQTESIRSGTLLRTTSTGDSLWMRFYQYHDDQVDQGRGAFRDVLPTPDGGFVAVGTASPTPVHDQDLWVVKVDGHGCLEPGCHIITGMEVQITNLGGALKLWPNPVPRGMPVQVEVQLPEGLAVQGGLRITVTDGAGRLVHEQGLHGTAGQPASPAGRLTTDNWQPGLYHVHLHDATRWIAGGKVVVE